MVFVTGLLLLLILSLPNKLLTILETVFAEHKKSKRYIEKYNQEFKEDVKFEIVKNMIKNNRPIRHIIEDTGYTEKEITKLKEIIALVKKACAMLTVK